MMLAKDMSPLRPFREDLSLGATRVFRNNRKKANRGEGFEKALAGFLLSEE